MGRWGALVAVAAWCACGKVNPVSDAPGGGGDDAPMHDAPPGTFPLTVTVVGGGTVTSTPIGIDCGTSCAADFPANTQVALTAMAAASGTFTGWSGACSGT